MLKALSDADLLTGGGLSDRVRGLGDLRAVLASQTVDGLCEIAGVSADVVRAAAKAFAAADNGIILYGNLALTVGAPLLDTVAALALATGKVGRANSGMIGLTTGGNTRGAIDMGVRPDAGAKAGLSAQQMLAAAQAGTLKGLYVAASDPAAESPVAAEALRALDFLVVQDLFLTETAKLADVVLPLAAITEREGTTTNAERRVQRFRQAQRTDADVLSVWEAAQQIAAMVREGALVGAVSNGKPTRSAAESWDYTVAEDVTGAIATGVRGYANATIANLSIGTGTWGRQSNEQVYYDGTSYANSEGVGVQLASGADDGKSALTIAAAKSGVPAVQAPAGLSLLVAPRAYDSRDWGRGSKLAPRMVPAHIILSVADAQSLGVSLGDHLVVESQAGAVTLPAQIDAGLASGLALAPDVRGAGLAGVATGAFTAVTIRKAE
jgi:NADH-quinone oxidoreductase subunit G